MSHLTYVSHPRVRVDPHVPVTSWSLSDEGRRQAAAALEYAWLASARRIVTSPERKAIETAELFASRLGLPVAVRHGTGEIDRSATGFVPPERHEQLADECFARAGVSAGGWETAEHAQARIVRALADVLVDDDDDVVVVGHGGVGTLLWCHLAGVPISRVHDQPGQGHYWTFDRTTQTILHGWEPLDPAAG
jgi:broad specificity phosphatase PhoE